MYGRDEGQFVLGNVVEFSEVGANNSGVVLPTADYQRGVEVDVGSGKSGGVVGGVDGPDFLGRRSSGKHVGYVVIRDGIVNAELRVVSEDGPEDIVLCRNPIRTTVIVNSEHARTGDEGDGRVSSLSNL